MTFGRYTPGDLGVGQPLFFTNPASEVWGVNERGEGERRKEGEGRGKGPLPLGGP